MKKAQMGTDLLVWRDEAPMRTSGTTSKTLPPSLYGVTSRQPWDYPREVTGATWRTLLLRRVLLGGCAGAALLFAWNTLAWLGQLGKLPWLTALGIYARALRAYLPPRPDG